MIIFRSKLFVFLAGAAMGWAIYALEVWVTDLPQPEAPAAPVPPK